MAAPWRLALGILKNVVAVVLLLAGVAMLVLPGQGVATILVGLLMMDFPRKKELQRRILSMPAILRTVNALRTRTGEPPLVVSDAGAGAARPRYASAAFAPVLGKVKCCGRARLATGGRGETTLIPCAANRFHAGGVKSHPVVGLIATFVLVGCQKSDTSPAGAASATVAQAASPAGALKDFEGEVDVLVKSTKEPRQIPPIAILVKGAKLRFDLPEGMQQGPKLGGKAYGSW